MILPEWWQKRVSMVPEVGCWLWMGHINHNGYGISGDIRAHRLAYMEYVGPIQDGLQIDHLCRNRWCCNPSHLEPVTAAENRARSRYDSGRVSTCRRGHDLSVDGLYIHPTRGEAECMACVSLRSRRRYARKKQEQATADNPDVEASPREGLGS